MKKEFSNKWVGSRQPRKQRKYLANAPLHVKHRLLSANLSKELRKKYSRRSFPLKKGDKVKIIIGEFKGKVGKISLVNSMKLKVAIDGIQRTKKDGTKINVLVDPSNLQIQELNLEDKRRIKSIGKKITISSSKKDEKLKAEFKKLPKTQEKEENASEKK